MLDPETCLGRDMDCGRPLPCPDHPSLGRIVGDLADDQYDAAYAAYEDDQASLPTRPGEAT